MFQSLTSSAGPRGVLAIKYAVISLSLLLSFAIATERSLADATVVPPEEWSDLPSWSPDASKVVVPWPAPARILPNGALDRQVNSKKRGITSQLNPMSLSSTSKPPVVVYSIPLADKTLLLDAKTFERLPLEIAGKMWRVTWSSNGKLFAGETIRSLAIYDLSTKQSTPQLTLDTPGLTRFAWCPDSKHIAVNQKSGVEVWNVETKRPTMTMPDLSGNCDSIAWSPDGKNVAACCGLLADDTKNAIRICNIDSGKVIFSIDLPKVHSLGWSPDGKWFVYCEVRYTFCAQSQ